MILRDPARSTLRSGQYDDIEGAAARILIEDEADSEAGGP